MSAELCASTLTGWLRSGSRNRCSFLFSPVPWAQKGHPPPSVDGSRLVLPLPTISRTSFNLAILQPTQREARPQRQLGPPRLLSLKSAGWPLRPPLHPLSKTTNWTSLPRPRQPLVTGCSNSFFPLNRHLNLLLPALGIYSLDKSHYLDSLSSAQEKNVGLT